jgi:PIN domain nuclease of toxin-antitoxin system
MATPALLLDTHYWIWLLLGTEHMSQTETQLFERAAQDGNLFVSAASFWEAAQLIRKGRLEIDRPVYDWLMAGVAGIAAKVLPITPEIACLSQTLPEPCHNDPGDRFLMATARVHDLTLVTRDSAILAYAAAGYVRVTGA